MLARRVPASGQKSKQIQNKLEQILISDLLVFVVRMPLYRPNGREIQQNLFK